MTDFYYEPLTDEQVDSFFDEDDRALNRAEDLDDPVTEAFYPEWIMPREIDVDFLPDYDEGDIPF